MSNKNILYDIGNGKVRGIANSYYDTSNNKLFSEKLAFNSASIGLNYGVLYTNNTLFSSSVQATNQILAWDSINNRWIFMDPLPIDASTTPVPANSDVSGTYFNNLTVKSLSNVQTGTLPVSRGGTGLITADYVSGERVLVSDGTNKLTFANSYSSSAIAISTYDKAIALASLSASSATDQSIYSNTLTFVKGQFTTSSVNSPFGASRVLSSSYDGVAGNYTAAITLKNAHSGDFTLEGWTYLANAGASAADNNRSIIFQSNDSTKFSLLIQASSTYSLTGNYGLYDGGSTVVNTGINFIPNQWVHCVLARNNNVYRAYINGTGSVLLNAAQNTSFSTIYFGTNGTANWNINGYMSEMRFVNYCKTPDEIKSYYQSVIAGTKGRYDKNDMDTRNHLVNNIAISVDENGKSITGSAVNPENARVSSDGIIYYP